MKRHLKIDEIPDNPYLLLTPGPLSTSKGVKNVMLQDWCTWDKDYNTIVQNIRKKLVQLATNTEGYTSVLMQGSGTFSVESVVTSAVPRDGKLLVLANGAYGLRIATIAQRCGVPYQLSNSGEVEIPEPGHISRILDEDPSITHVAMVHCETTTGMLNPIETVGEIVKDHNRIYIVDAMSSFGGIPMDMESIGADYLVSSANKCIQGVPGFGFVIAKQNVLEETKGRAGSLSLDLYDQWQTMEQHSGKWRFTSPTHTVRAFAHALEELESEGGVAKRYERYSTNHDLLIQGMEALGFVPLLPKMYRSPIITSFYSPNHPEYQFKRFYGELKKSGFVIYPGKVTNLDTFRIGNIGEIYPEDITRLTKAVKSAMYWK
ncbi:2-aminoethylphosphonate--pyruvate transaminase [Desulfamplus magnetovallimortis]|uniref:2-aminoethylphosphonate--pyruvate transaminase n=1 Tax=Desulfamplus magnetovallimortis TaxID=1246637 RepID=A0A1W1HKH1_9BACT|nr:2-aminoethylphosphonate--pyruvate transaminase [Desulfamplus magnetovallimortis]SLM32915.1 2-aminoethylphosphonate--pyruvate transaminase [Desulfamplus magnetovallimortis]